MLSSLTLETLVLSDEDVKNSITMEETLEVVENALKEKGLGYTQMPPKVYLHFRQYNGDLRTMPSYLERLIVAGVKIVNVHPHNPRTCGKPTVMATIILIDPRDGSPLAIIGANTITAMRTGAIGGIATKYLARKDSSVLGLIGAGVQAKSQLSAISKVRALEQVRVCDKEQRVVEQFIKDAEHDYSLNFRACLKAEECVSGADIISTTTPSSTPIVKNEWVSPGVHINAIGADAPGKEELDPFILKRAKIVVDDTSQAVHSGEINVPFEKGIIGMADIFAELDEVILGKKKGRASENEITVFDSTGLSLQDVATAHLVLEKAKRNCSGKRISIM